MESSYETEIVNLSYEELIGLYGPPGFGSELCPQFNCCRFQLIPTDDVANTHCRYLHPLPRNGVCEEGKQGEVPQSRQPRP